MSDIPESAKGENFGAFYQIVGDKQYRGDRKLIGRFLFQYYDTEGQLLKNKESRKNSGFSCIKAVRGINKKFARKAVLYIIEKNKGEDAAAEDIDLEKISKFIDDGTLDKWDSEREEMLRSSPF